MKEQKWTGRKPAFLILATAMLALTACQQQALDPQRAQYQAKANDVLNKYARRISSAYQQSQQNQQSNSSFRGFWGGGWNPWGGDPYGGTVISKNIETEIQNCVSLVRNIPKNRQNYYFMIASLGRCLDVVVSYRNPMMTFAYRHLDGVGQYHWSYLLNYSRPGSLYDFSQQDYGAWSSYAGLGFYGP